MARQNQGEYAGLKGGQKQMWLRQHRDEILEYMAKHSKGATMFKFGITHLDTLDRLVKKETGEEREPTWFELMKARGLAETSLEMSRESQRQLRELKEAFQSFVESVGEQLALKFFLPLLRSAIQLPPGLEPEPDNRLNLNTLFGCPPELPEGQDVVGDAEQILEASKEPALEDRLQADRLLTLLDRLDAAHDPFYDAYAKACDNGDWYAALAMYQWMCERDIILDEEEGEEFIQAVEDWLAKAEKPDELNVCYFSSME